MTAEQWEAEAILQEPDKSADRGLGNIQFLGCSSEAAMAPGGLECTQSIQRRQASHRFDPNLRLG